MAEPAEEKFRMRQILGNVKRSLQRDDLNYFRRRAGQEQIAAQKATCEAARKRHDELAAMYGFRMMMLSNDLAFEPNRAPEGVAETVG